MDYRLEFLRSREKDPLLAKYSTFPGWHSPHVYQQPTATYLQHLSEHNSSSGEPKTWTAVGIRTSQDIHDVYQRNKTCPSQSRLSYRELTDYIGQVRNREPIEKQRSDKGRCGDRDIYAHCEGWKSTWPITWKGKRENFGTSSHQELQAYASCHRQARSQKTSGFEIGDWRSSESAEEVLGCGQWVNAETTERFQPTALTAHKQDKTELSYREREPWSKWSPWDSRNTQGLFPVESFGQPPSYTAPPAYSSPKDGDKLAYRAKVTTPISVKAFPEQTFESGNVNQTQGPESYCSDITGQEALNTASPMKYAALQTKPPSSHAHLQSLQMTYPDITQKKQNKLTRRKGGETVFCLVSRMGEVSGLSSSPEEPLKSHVLPLLTDSKPEDLTTTTEQTSPQSNGGQNQGAHIKRDEDERLHESLIVGGNGNTPQEAAHRDQTSNSIVSNVIKPGENEQELQCYVQGNDPQKTSMQTAGDEKPCKEIVEKFPLWKEPKHQEHLTGVTEQRNEQSQEIVDESEMSNTEDVNHSRNDRSLVVIDATCVVVKVELVLLPEKEHVQYVCLAEDSPLSSREETDEQKKHSSVISSQETPENNTLEEGIEPISGLPHEDPGTGVQSIQQEHDHSCESDVVDPTKESEESPLATETVDEWQALGNEQTGQPGRGTTSWNKECLEEMLKRMTAEDQTSAEAQAVLEDFRVSTNAKPTLEAAEVQTEKTPLHLNQALKQENELNVEDSVVQHEPREDKKNPQKDTPKELTKDSSIEDKLSEDTDEPWGTLGLDCCSPPPEESTENTKETQEVVLPSIVGTTALRRSRSSPHLSFTPMDSHTPKEPPALTPSPRTEAFQSSGSPRVQSSGVSSPPPPASSPLPDALEGSSLQKENEPSDLLPCVSSASEHKKETQHAKSLWAAVSRIRKHTAPDSETEEDEVLEFGEQTEDLDTDLSETEVRTGMSNTGR